MGIITNVFNRKTHNYSSRGLISKCCNSSVHFIGGNEGDFLAIPTTICNQCMKECNVFGPADHAWMRRLEFLKVVSKLLRKGNIKNINELGHIS